MGPTRPYLSHPIFPSTDRGNKQSAGNKHALLTCASQNKAAPIDRKGIAHALHQRNVLRVTESIQILPNGRFCSIKFTTPLLMQTFSTEGLTISENNTVYFKPDFKPRQNRTYSFISFLNVPLETKEKEMDAYVKQFCTVRGVHYPFQKIDDIKYHNGTNVYRVSTITEHLPKADHIFGRWVRIIYDDNQTGKNIPHTTPTKLNLKIWKHNNKNSPLQISNHQQ